MLSRADRARIQRIARGRSDESLHVLEGPKAVQEALQAGQVHELWIRADLDAERSRGLRAAAGAGGAAIHEGSVAEFGRLATTVTSQGVLALVHDSAVPLGVLFDVRRPLLWLDGVQDPGNVGAIVRVAAAFAFGGLLVGTGSADPLGLKALRASTGLALRVPFARASAEDITEALGATGRPVWALDRGGDDLLALEEIPADLILAVGAEGPGLGAAARQAATRKVGIELAAGVDSLNAAVAVGIAAAHVARRTSS